jgi:hypothetical protein
VFRVLSARSRATYCKPLENDFFSELLVNRPLSIVCLILSIAGTAQASDAQRRINGCMTKRMSADRLISYNDAKRACVEDLKGLNVRLDAGSLKHDGHSVGGGEASGN